MLFEYFGNTSTVKKTLYRIPLDLTGRQNEITNYLGCFHANNCIVLREGKLYTCTTAAFADIFYKYFEIDFPFSESNSINIHSDTSAKEIMEFLSQPIPFCRYCYVYKRTYQHEWEVSKKDFSEWTICQ